MCRESIELDSLRTSILAFQDSIVTLGDEKSQWMEEFKQINEHIYQYKMESENKNQPLQQFRLKNALKSSREIADRIAHIDRQILAITTQLQKKYHKIIKAIDLEIQNYLDETAPDRSGIKIIQQLGKEKLNYLNQLQTIQMDDEEWKNLEIEPDDTPGRIQMKTAILNDKLNKIERSIIQEEEKLSELKQDRKVQHEMLGFYLELSRTLEDEQDMFDRSRLDDLKDHLQVLSDNIEKLENYIIEMKVSTVNLRKKISHFSDSPQNK